MLKKAISASEKSRASASPTAKFCDTAEIQARPAFSPFAVASVRASASVTSP